MASHISDCSQSSPCLLRWVTTLASSLGCYHRQARAGHRQQAVRQIALALAPPNPRSRQARLVRRRPGRRPQGRRRQGQCKGGGGKRTVLPLARTQSSSSLESSTTCSRVYTPRQLHMYLQASTPRGIDAHPTTVSNAWTSPGRAVDVAPSARRVYSRDRGHPRVGAGSGRTRLCSSSLARLCSVSLLLSMRHVSLRRCDA